MRKYLLLLCCCLLVACHPEELVPEYSAVTGEASEITYHSANVSGVVSFPMMTAADLTFGILYSKKSGVLFSMADKAYPEQFDDAGNFTVALTGLRPETKYYYRSFLFQDGKVIYGETKSFQTEEFYLPKGAVDLGLSVLWCGCNVGATQPWEYGGYYAWGEITTKSNYDWGTYLWCEGGATKLTKYNLNTSLGPVDGRTELEEADDVAAQTLGGLWRMPTDAEWTELREKCNWVWTVVEGVAGQLVTSKTNGNSIFLPAAGFFDGNKVGHAGDSGYYWSSSLVSSDSRNAWNVDIYSSGPSRDPYGYRYSGQSIRPVRPR